MMEQSTIRYGMIGGGQGAFIGDVHRRAIALDGLAELVAGCFSRSPENTLATGNALGVSPERRCRTFTDLDFPGVEMGIDGVQFINKCVESSDKGAVWVNY
jgi:hypothetical protein